MCCTLVIGMTEVLRAQIKEKLMASNLCSDDGGAPVIVEPNQAVVASLVSVAAVRLTNLAASRRAVGHLIVVIIVCMFMRSSNSICIFNRQWF